MKRLEWKQGSQRHCLVSEHWCGLSVLRAGLTPSGWAQQFPPDFLRSSGGTSGERPKGFPARVCVRDTEGQAGLSQGQLCLLSLKVISSGLSSLLCTSKFRRGKKKFWLIFFILCHPPHPPSLARCSLLATAHNSFLGGCCQSYSILPGTQKGYSSQYPISWNIRTQPLPGAAWFGLCEGRSRYFPLWKEDLWVAIAEGLHSVPSILISREAHPSHFQHPPFFNPKLEWPMIGL